MDQSTALMDTIHDAVHGPIDLRDECRLSGCAVIGRLVNAPFLLRLRLIKQLSYSSHFVTSADHSRFAHALGTMHVMRSLMRNLRTASAFNLQAIFDCLDSEFPQWTTAADAPNPKVRYNLLTQHMLVSALLQDVGELPSNIATTCFCYPGQQFQDALTSFDFCSMGLSHKELLGLGIVADYLSKSEQEKMKQSMCWPLVFSLISGKLKDGKPLPAALKCLNHLLDGEVDADRIDYVHRDALHCLGEKISPAGLVHSLIALDEGGPVFSNSGAVSFFFLLRARLWSSVYCSPQNRFRLALLLTVMRAARHSGTGPEKRRLCKTLFGTSTPEKLTMAEFMALHDHQLTIGIDRLASIQTDALKHLGTRAHNALLLLKGSVQPDYECIWVSQSTEQQGATQDVVLPHSVFFDTFTDCTAIKTFRKQTIRIKSPEFCLRENSTVYLEESGGPFAGWFDSEPCPAPMLVPYSVMVYAPKNGAIDVNNFIHKCKTASNAVLSQVLEENPFVPFELHDTRKEIGFTGPDIFISFCWEDILYVRRVLVALYQLRKRYFAITSRTHGVGNSPQRNSEMAAMNAGAVLIIASKDYCKKLKDKDSSVRAEMEIVRKRRGSSGSLRCAVLSVCSYSEIKNDFDYEYVADDRKNFPYVGKALSETAGTQLHELVASASNHLEARQ